ncbi:MAG: farnesyl diphosphate synthase [Hornefia sp.]|nr:farnesyl diphosphate synthase [Hornefia sp.]
MQIRLEDMMRENYDEYKALVEEHLLDFMPNVDSKSQILYDAMKYSLTAGGKRLRPVLLLAACEFAGGNSAKAIPFACAIEYIHTYSLIHDDLPCMDDDEMRRGKPTNHMVYGDGIATLAGDGLLNSAFEIMNKNMMLFFDDIPELKKRINASYAISKGAGVQGMIAGQVSDIESENKKCSEEMLEYIHLNKTGELLSVAIMAGLFLGGADQEMISKMKIYAENMGLAFQIADDILDVTGNPDEMGKKPSEDIKHNKVTYVSMYGLEKSEKKLHELTEKAIESIADYYDNAEFFRDLVLRLEKRTK